LPLSEFAQSVYAEAWPLVQDAARINPDTGRASYTAADVQAAAGQLYARASGAEAFAYRAALGQLYGMAVSNARAGQALSTADLSAGLDASMIGSWPTAAGPQIQAVQPEYMAKMEFTYTTVTGDQATAWITLTGLTELPSQVGTLQGMMTGRALTAYTTPESQGGKYLPGQMLAQFGEVTSMQLYAV